ncbi:toll/interleukin-1 receptor domain-containing protein [Rubrivivax sp. RP6-9]|uniref:toll/interleukin-1 receptor domain-containing protein n=1 Tax=Rubrivivax sp. RP6-9 TaxID=3415750 RepID=UPI003CC68549
MEAVRIFISYRRDDAAGYARAVYDALAQRFGAAQVFMDVDDIPAGQAFDAVIRQAVGSAGVLVALIGPRWRGERRAADGLPPRILADGDFVRHEIASALAQGLTVVPVLLEGTPMPTAAQLPPDLQPLLLRNALPLDNTRFAADIDRLAAALRLALGTPAAAPRRRWLLAGGAVLAAAAVAGAAVLLLRPRAPPRPAINGRWQGSVHYDWPGARHDERFDFAGDGTVLTGTASFLGVPRPIRDGSVDADGLRFAVHTGELGSDRVNVQRYHARLVDGELRVVVQTESAGQAHRPVEFVARR